VTVANDLKPPAWSSSGVRYAQRVHRRDASGRQWSMTVRRGDHKSQLPMHGSRKELGTKLVNKILKELGLK
jgi:hypothetical protein